MSGQPVAFYCVADERYFLGAVAMINSLRHHGHGEPIYLLDCGLRDEQRRLLDSEVELLDSPYAAFPLLLSTIAPCAHPAEVMVLIDADMIVTRSLGELIERARGGRVLACRASYDRYVPEWGELLELGEIRRQPYASAGLSLFGGAIGAAAMALFDQLCAFVELDFRARELPPYPADYPFVALDQDVFNAIAASRLAPSEFELLDYRLAPNQPFEGLRPAAEGWSCEYEDGTVPYVVHHVATKPWQARIAPSIYSGLLARYLWGPGLALRVPASAAPPRLRHGARGALARRALEARHRLGWRLRERLPAAAVERLDDRRRRRTLGVRAR